MSCTSELSRSQEYLSFRSSVPLRKIVVDADGTKVIVKLNFIASKILFNKITFKIDIRWPHEVKTIVNKSYIWRYNRIHDDQSQ